MNGPTWLSDDEEPVDIDVEAALSCLDNDINARLTLWDPQGRKVASVEGLLDGPEGFPEEDRPLVLYVLRVDEMTVAICLPADPATKCTIEPDGTVTGRLPGGPAWSVVPLDSPHNE
jgi:hypothetical protein